MGRRHKRRSVSREMKRRKQEQGRADERPLTARQAVNQATHNNRSTPFMQKLVPFNWEWDESFAQQMGCDEGYYQVPNLVGSWVISPDDAQELYVQHNWHKVQEPRFNGHHADQLAARMKVGVAIDIALGPDNFPKIVNGQHTLWAIRTAGRSMQVAVTVYMCRNEQGMANLYAIFDSNRSRTASHVVETHKRTGNLDIDHPASRHHKWAQCVACAENDFCQPKKQQTNAAKLEHACRPEVVKFAKWIEARIESTSQIKGLVPMGIGAGFYAMYRADPVKAERFLQMYLSGVGLTEQHPVLILRNRLTINKPLHEHSPTACRLHAEIMYTCWRRFCLDEKMQATRRTTRLPAWDKWGIYVPPTKATLKLGGQQVEIAI